MVRKQDGAACREPVDERAPLQRTSSGSAINLLLVVGLVLAAFLRLYDLGVQDFWIDEIHTLANASAQRAAFPFLIWQAL